MDDYDYYYEDSDDDDDDDDDYDYDEQINLYHYTSESCGLGIKRDKKIKKSSLATPWSHRRHGLGVYFTSLDPSNNPTKLVANNFLKNGSQLQSGSTLFEKIRYVVRVTFQKDQVEKKKDGDRDIYLYRGDVYLEKYAHSVGPNPNYP